MAETLKKGDGVRLLVELEPREEKDALNKPYWTAVEVWDKKQKPKGPFKLFDNFVGIYMGMDYITLSDKRSTSGQMQRPKHCFYFNDNRVYIDPKHVEVVARLDDGED